MYNGSLPSASLNVGFVGLLAHKWLQINIEGEEAKNQQAFRMTGNYVDTMQTTFLYPSSHHKRENNVIYHKNLTSEFEPRFLLLHVQSSYLGLTLLYPKQQKDFSANEGP